MRERPASTAPGARPLVPLTGLALPGPASLAFFVLNALVAFSLMACDTDLLAEAPAAICTEVGVQCVLPSGPLGVCERSTCEPGISEPCYACVSQH